MLPTSAKSTVGDYSWVKSLVNFLFEWVPTMSRWPSAKYESQALGAFDVYYDFVLKHHP